MSWADRADRGRAKGITKTMAFYYSQMRTCRGKSGDISTYQRMVDQARPRRVKPDTSTNANSNMRPGTPDGCPGRHGFHITVIVVSCRRVLSNTAIVDEWRQSMPALPHHRLLGDRLRRVHPSAPPSAPKGHRESSPLIASSSFKPSFRTQRYLRSLISQRKRTRTLSVPRMRQIS